MLQLGGEAYDSRLIEVMKALYLMAVAVDSTAAILNNS